jgi:hypothetical protein
LPLLRRGVRLWLAGGQAAGSLANFVDPRYESIAPRIIG